MLKSTRPSSNGIPSNTYTVVCENYTTFKKKFKTDIKHNIKKENKYNITKIRTQTKTFQVKFWFTHYFFKSLLTSSEALLCILEFFNSAHVASKTSKGFV